MEEKSKLLDYVQRNRIASYMNNTKWEKLVLAINSDPDYLPRVRIKYLYDQEISNAFNPVWWKEVKQYGYEYIEWIEISPIVEEYIGRLVSDKVVNYHTFIESALKSCNQPYEIHDGVFKIYGYRRLG